jgi:segregation and condensation protein B
MTPELKYIIESLLFVADAPLTLDRIKTVLGVTDSQAVRAAITALGKDYEARGGGFFLEEVAGGFQLRSRPEYTEYIRRLVRPAPVRLSKAALETLAIIAYKQPVIRTDVEHIRGVDCGGVVRMLLERRLVRVLGRKEIPGRPLLYGTTKQFLEVFGLKDLKELPSPKEIEEFGRNLTDSQGSLFVLDEAEQVPPEETEAEGWPEINDAGQREPGWRGDKDKPGSGDTKTEAEPEDPEDGCGTTKADTTFAGALGGSGDAQADPEPEGTLEGGAPA